MWTWVHITRWVGWYQWAERVLGVRWAGCQQEETAPQVGWKRNLLLSGAMVPQETNQTDLLPCLGSKTHFWSHQVVKEPHTHCCAGLSLTPGPDRAELVGNPSSPCRRLVWGRTDSRMKTTSDKDRLHWEDAKKCSGITQSWIIKYKCNLRNMKVSKSIGEVAQNFLEPHAQS